MVEIPHRAGAAHGLVTGIDRQAARFERNGLCWTTVVGETTRIEPGIRRKANVTGAVRVEIVATIADPAVTISAGDARDNGVLE